LELRVDWTRTDIHRFERLAATGREQLAAGDLVEAAETLRLALGLWRGEPLGDFADQTWARPEMARLYELRLGTLEDQVDAGLGLGNPAVLPIVERLVALHPWRERLRGQLMRALYNAGRQTDALAAYQDARRTLIEELGLEPGPQLQQLHANVLSQLAVPVGQAPSSIPDADEETKLTVARPPSVAPTASRQTQTRTTEAIARLFDDWAFRLARGESPNPHTYLEQAGDNAAELRLLMDTYVRALPRPTPTHEDIERAQAWLAATPRTEL
jgi:DNA-binding SARP family transcriptional activator